MLADKLYGIAQLVEEGDKRLFTAQDIHNICTVIQAQMTRYEERLGELKKSRKDEEFDEDDQAELEEAYELESGVVARVSDIVHYMFVVRTKS